MESWEQIDLVAIYCGDDAAFWILPADVIMIVLGYAGLARRSRHHTYFVLWS